MSTTRQQRADWVSQGSTDASARTYNSVRAALDRSDELHTIDYSVFLQGSYANHTNTRGDSDVDVVVMMTSTFSADTNRLSTVEQQTHEKRRLPPTTSASEFRDIVQRALVRYYGSSRVEPKNKCLRVAKASGYVDADVVPALVHKLYTSYPSVGEPTYIEGIAINPLRGERVVNYPKEHIRNGEAKNRETNGNYKPAVRQLKRLRRLAVDGGLLGPKDASGYLLECLTSNIDNSYFVNDPSDRIVKLVSYLSLFDATTLAREMRSGDRIHKLFVDDPGGHDEFRAKRVLTALYDFL